MTRGGRTSAALGRIAFAAVAACAGCAALLGEDVLTFRAASDAPDGAPAVLDGAADGPSSAMNDAEADATVGRQAPNVACGEGLDCAGSCCAEDKKQHCIDAGAPCKGAVLECSGSPECPPGTFCCLRQRDGGASSRCESSCAGGRTMCHEDAGPDNGCANGRCGSKGVADWKISGEFELCQE